MREEMFSAEERKMFEANMEEANKRHRRSMILLILVGLFALGAMLSIYYVNRVELSLYIGLVLFVLLFVIAAANRANHRSLQREFDEQIVKGRKIVRTMKVRSKNGPGKSVASDPEPMFLLELVDCDNDDTALTASVNKSFYDRLEPDDEVEIHLMKATGELIGLKIADTNECVDTEVH